MRLLVTGGLGFIGRHVVTGARSDGHEVRVLDALLPAAHGERGVTAASRGLGPHVEVVHGDVRNLETVSKALDGVDVVCHQAAMVGLGVDLDDLPEYVSHNDLGTAVLLRAMAGRVGHLVLASSMVVYGEGAYACAEHGSVRAGPRLAEALAAGQFEPPCPICGAPLTGATVDESAPLDPRNAYAATKVAQEYLSSCWARETGGSVVALRYHNVYGPGMPRDTPYAGVASIFRSALERGDAPQVYEDGRQRRDFVHVTDVARANLAAIGSRDRGAGELRAFNVASGEPHTVGEMATALAGAFGGPQPVVTGNYRLGDVRHVVAAPMLAERDLGFHAEVRFGDGMREFATAPLRG